MESWLVLSRQWHPAKEPDMGILKISEALLHYVLPLPLHAGPPMILLGPTLSLTETRQKPIWNFSVPAGPIINFCVWCNLNEFNCINKKSKTLLSLLLFKIIEKLWLEDHVSQSYLLRLFMRKLMGHRRRI